MAANPTPNKIHGGTDTNVTRFFLNYVSADLTGCESIIADVAGRTLVIEKIWISSATATNVTIGAYAAPHAVTTTVDCIGPLFVEAAGGNFIVLDFSDSPWQLTAGKGLVADAADAEAVTILVRGYYI